MTNEVKEAISAFKEWIERDKKIEYADRLENIEIYKLAIKALEQGDVLDKIKEEINTPNRGTCDYFIVDRIEEIINKYKVESEERND